MYMYTCYVHSLCSVCVIGLNITEVAHDCQAQVKKYIIDDLGMVNSFDTWHGNSIIY